jgi:pyruvate dehydrogenase E1 component
LLGGTAGRTTLAGEGLQHQDGQSHVLALSVPNLRAYDPAFAYELAVIVRDGIERMYVNQEKLFYYLTVMNEFYVQPPMPAGAEEGILKGLYRFRRSESKTGGARAQLVGSGAILNEAVAAARLLEERYDVPADVWSATSYKELFRDAMDCERWNLLHPDRKPKRPYIARVLADEEGAFVAASDYLKYLPESVSRWFPGGLTVLGTDGFGRSETREALRNFFEVDARYIALAALRSLALRGDVDAKLPRQALRDLEIDPEKLNPFYA